MKVSRFIFYTVKNKCLWFEVRKRILLRFFCKDIQARANEERRLAYKKLSKKYHGVVAAFKPQMQSAKKQSNYVWVFWESGYDDAPELVKSCINSIKKAFYDRQVIVLDKNNLTDYIDFPDYISQKHSAGKIKAAHYSDLVRLELLCRYGGIWLDSTVLCTSDKIPDYITRAPLFVYKSLCLKRDAFQYTRCSSWLISSESNNDILMLARTLLLAYWKDFDYDIDYFIIHLFMSMASRRFPEQWQALPTFNNHTPHTMMFELQEAYTTKRWEQLTSISPIHKLERHTDFSHCRGTFYNHILKSYGGAKNV